MDPIKRYSLEDFAERHRADFDLHEPRPELWEALTARLEADLPAQPHLRIATEPAVAAPLAAAPAPAEPMMTIAAPVAAPLPQPRLRSGRRWQPVGIAAALLALVVAAGLGEVWKSRREAQVAATVGRYQPDADAALTLGAGPDAMTASQGGPNGNARLDTAVHGMERYYAAQLADRQTQLGQLTTADAAEWTQELVSLDSSYQRLKAELPRHPQPEVVLTAMNRNLQIRLDILDRQLELRGTDRLARTGGGEFVLADSRSRSYNFWSGDAR